MLVAPVAVLVVNSYPIGMYGGPSAVPVVDIL